MRHSAYIRVVMEGGDRRNEVSLSSFHSFFLSITVLSLFLLDDHLQFKVLYVVDDTLLGIIDLISLVRMTDAAVDCCSREAQEEIVGVHREGPVVEQ